MRSELSRPPEELSVTLRAVWHRVYADFAMPSRLGAYQRLLEAALDAGYAIVSIEWLWDRIQADTLDLNARYLVLRHDVDTYITGGAGAIIYDDLMSPGARKPLAHQARREVAGASRNGWNDDAYGFSREVLSANCVKPDGACQQETSYQRLECHPRHFNSVSPRAAIITLK